MPELALATAAATRQISTAKAELGAGLDAPDIAPLLYDAWRHAAVRTVIVHAGYDSEANHRFARPELGVAWIIPPRVGRPGAYAPAGCHRGIRKKRFRRNPDAKAYGQRR